jgi:hypothetical protein
MLAVCSAGRILNPKSARSQVIGAMTMGVGAALMEELAVDKRLGFFVNHDLAGYGVPVHADSPHQDVIFLDEIDPISSLMKAKGVGELGLCGVGAASANASTTPPGSGCAIRSPSTSCWTLARGRLRSPRAAAAKALVSAKRRACRRRGRASTSMSPMESTRLSSPSRCLLYLLASATIALSKIFDAWIAALAIGVVVIIVGGLLGWIGASRLKSGNLTTLRTIRSLKDDAAWASERLHHG